MKCSRTVFCNYSTLHWCLLDPRTANCPFSAAISNQPLHQTKTTTRTCSDKPTCTRSHFPRLYTINIASIKNGKQTSRDHDPARILVPRLLVPSTISLCFNMHCNTTIKCIKECMRSTEQARVCQLFPSALHLGAGHLEDLLTGPCLCGDVLKLTESCTRVRGQEFYLHWGQLQRERTESSDWGHAQPCMGLSTTVDSTTDMRTPR